MSADPQAVAIALATWYPENARSLPWRDDPRPYPVLLSELMLQQTRIDTAIPYFHRFLARWPTIQALAGATEDEVLEAWAGLGYYSRARNLLKCAKLAAEEGLPSDPAALRRLPGIGPYTAGAVASIAYGVRAGVVDGNVERVLSRLDAREADPRSTAGKRALWQRVEDLHRVHTGHPGDLNQALMELGATVCTPRSPRCLACPVERLCEARKTGRETQLPIKAKKKPPRPVYAVAGLLRRQGQVLMGQRPKSGLLAGLWEPIGTDLPGLEDAGSGLQSGFLSRCGLAVEVGPRLGEVVHVFTHRRLTCWVYAIDRWEGEPRLGEGYIDLAWSDGSDLALSSLARKILALGAVPQMTLPLGRDVTAVAKT
jgi:A/G-specific adenine glycosylase